MQQPAAYYRALRDQESSPLCKPLDWIQRAASKCPTVRHAPAGAVSTWPHTTNKKTIQGLAITKGLLGPNDQTHHRMSDSMTLAYFNPPARIDTRTRTARERERELRKEGREVPSRVRLREGPIGVRITLGQPTIG